MAWLTRLLINVIPNKKIFCNAPWFELQIYWNGDYGICCAESRKLYGEDKLITDHPYNIKNMSISEWYNSQPVRDFRQSMYEDKQLDICSKCVAREKHSKTSRRHRSNQKSVILNKIAFEESFDQSPHKPYFQYSVENEWKTKTVPMDLHVDLGNYCNLACKMCWPLSSSKIASQLVKWGDNSAKEFLGNDWTKNKKVWNKFLEEIKTLPLVNVHFMGGETLITNRFHDFVNHMIDANKTDFGISFVTNGTILDIPLIEKLKNFKRTGIEISIESLTDANAYIRQGTNTNQVLDHIDAYLEHCNNCKTTVTIRPTPSALSVSSYHTLLRYCLDKKLVIKSSLLVNPEFLKINVIPKNIRQTYKQNYLNIIKDYCLNENTAVDYNESNPYQYKKTILTEINQIISCLDEDDHKDANNLAKILTEHCKKWDQVYKYNAYTIYPELTDWLKMHGY